MSFHFLYPQLLAQYWYIVRPLDTLSRSKLNSSWASLSKIRKDCKCEAKELKLYPEVDEKPGKIFKPGVMWSCRFFQCQVLLATPGGALGCPVSSPMCEARSLTFWSCYTHPPLNLSCSWCLCPCALTYILFHFRFHCIMGLYHFSDKRISLLLLCAQCARRFPHCTPPLPWHEMKHVVGISVSACSIEIE